MSFRVGGLLVH